MERFDEDIKNILLRKNQLSIRTKNQTSVKENESFDAINHNKLLFDEKFLKSLDPGKHSHFQLRQV